MPIAADRGRVVDRAAPVVFAETEGRVVFGVAGRAINGVMALQPDGIATARKMTMMTTTRIADQAGLVQCAIA